MNAQLQDKKEELEAVNFEIADLSSFLGLDLSCSSVHDCFDCTLNSACVWCPSENICTEGTVTGPASESCASFEYGQCSSVDCDAFSTCSSCIMSDQCGWCDSIQVCSTYNSTEGPDCLQSEFYSSSSEVNFSCPDSDEIYEILYSSDEANANKYTELQSQAIQLNIDISTLKGEIDDLNDLSASFLG